MRLSRLTILVILAAFLAFEPVIHSHPILPTPDAGGLTTPNLCAICAVGADHAVINPPALAPPVRIAHPLFVAEVSLVSTEGGVPQSSRAPPAA